MDPETKQAIDDLAQQVQIGSRAASSAQSPPDQKSTDDARAQNPPADGQTIGKSLEEITRKLDEQARTLATLTQMAEELGRQMEELRQGRDMI